MKSTYRAVEQDRSQSKPTAALNAGNEEDFSLGNRTVTLAPEPLVASIDLDQFVLS
ncbi:MAG TPA: hypothetical protein VFU08_05480 [Candidatus Udaeobacter sp.]|nr:hypothetical protein [Candidatus Udaeobacter sp.]